MATPDIPRPGVTLSCPKCNKTTFVVDENYCRTSNPGQHNAKCQDSSCGHQGRVFCAGGKHGEDRLYFLNMDDAIRYRRQAVDAQLDGVISNLGVPPAVFRGGPITGLINYPQRINRSDDDHIDLEYLSGGTSFIGDNPALPAGAITPEELQRIRESVREYSTPMTLEELTRIRQLVREHQNTSQRYLSLTGLTVGREEDLPTFDINNLPIPVIHQDFHFALNDVERNPMLTTHEMRPGGFCCRQCGATLREVMIFRNSFRNTRYSRDGTCHKDFRRTALCRALTYQGRGINERPMGVLQYVDMYTNQPIPVWQYTRQEAASLLNYLSFSTGLENDVIRNLISQYKHGENNLPILADAFEDAGYDDGMILMAMRDDSPVPTKAPSLADDWILADQAYIESVRARLNPNDWNAASNRPLDNTIRNVNLTDPPDENDDEDSDIDE